MSLRKKLTAKQSELGKKSLYHPYYDPNKLFPISRKEKRDEIGVPDILPFWGVDIWNHYEVSWLNAKGKPIVALAEIIYSCDSPNIIESKSMKLYFNSLNNSRFDSVEIVRALISKDIADRIKAPVTVNIKPFPLKEISGSVVLRKGAGSSIAEFDGLCLDHLDVECTTYSVNPDFLFIENSKVNETLFSNLLKSNCLVTNQPDWGSVQISYEGNKINHEGLLRYIVSFRNHHEFHEQCIERMFMDIMKNCKPEKLTIYGRYTRRGGIDINPIRSTHQVDIINNRLCRQ